jgi:hypothetical protein
VWSAANVTKEKGLYIIVRYMMMFHVSLVVSRLTIQGKTIGIMQGACLLSTVYRKLPFHGSSI